MAFGLYDAVVPGQVQVLGALAAILEKAKAHADATGVPEADLLGAKLAPDMFTLARQVVFVVAQSIGAIKGVRVGQFVAELSDPPDTFDALTALTFAAHAGMEALRPEEINSFLGRPMRFVGRVTHVEYLAEDYLLSFSQPNFFFHAVTTYDLLRHAGVPLGKRDYLGRLRVRT